MNHIRSSVAGATLNNGTVLWVTGGYEAKFKDQKTTEFVYFNGTVRPGPNLPESRARHCIVHLKDDKKVLIIGGYGTVAKSTLMVDLTNFKMTNGPDTFHERYAFGCTVFNSPRHGKRQVVMVAGPDDTIGTEIWDYTKSNRWEKCKFVPYVSIETENRDDSKRR